MPRHNKPMKSPLPKIGSAKPGKGKSLLEYQQAHDKDYIVPHRLKAAIAQLGPDGWEYEQAIISIAQISTTDLGAYRDQFAAFQAVATTTKSSGGGVRKKIIWCGSTAFAKKLGGPRALDTLE